MRAVRYSKKGADGIGDPRLPGSSEPLKATGRDIPARRQFPVRGKLDDRAGLLRRRRSGLGRRSSSSVGRSFAGSGSGVTSGSGRIGGGFASGGSSVTGSSSCVGRFGSGVLSGFHRSLFLLGASSERQRQRPRGEKHFRVHEIDHPNVMIG